MEGIDAHVTPEGDTVLTMISDEKFLDDPAHPAAAIHADGVMSSLSSSLRTQGPIRRGFSF
jgi:hypothetical protein